MSLAFVDFFDFSILEVLLKGFLIGLVAAAPTGPSGVLCIEQTLSQGRRAGLFTGAGIWVSDVIYIICSSIGLSLVVDFIQDKQTFLIIKIIGCALLLFFGIHTLRNNAIQNVTPTTRTKMVDFRCSVTGFVVAISNPLVIFIYLALFTYFTFPISEFSGYMAVLAYLAVFVGDMCWWFCLSTLINKVRNRFNLKSLWLINRVLGIVLVAASLVWLTVTIVKIC